MKEKDRPRGICYICIHCHLTNQVDNEREERIYECAMLNTNLTKTHFAIDCNHAYTGADE